MIESGRRRGELILTTSIGALKGKGDVPVITPVLFGMSTAIAPLMAVALWLSAFNCIVRRGQAIFVLGLLMLLMYAAIEFLFFIGLMSQQARHLPAQGEGTESRLRLPACLPSAPPRARQAGRLCYLAKVTPLRRSRRAR